MVYKIVLIRHGESTWNKENKFTGWYDCGLTELGEQEAKECGQTLLKEGYEFDIVFTSYLKRAIKTMWIVMEEMDNMYLPVYRHWRLNERHYGALQGLNKSETAKEHGEDKVKIWRRSYDTPPPALEESDERHPSHEKKYREVPKDLLPKTESLKLTVDRVLPYWNDNIVPHILRNEKVLVVAHGNSLRALVKHLDNMSDDEITQLNIPTGIPLVYELDDNLKPIRHYYLGDQEKIQQKIGAVAAQGQAK